MKDLLVATVRGEAGARIAAAGKRSNRLPAQVVSDLLRIRWLVGDDTAEVSVRIGDALRACGAGASVSPDVRGDVRRIARAGGKPDSISFAAAVEQMLIAGVSAADALLATEDSLSDDNLDDDTEHGLHALHALLRGLADPPAGPSLSSLLGWDALG